MFYQVDLETSFIDSFPAAAAAGPMQQIKQQLIDRCRTTQGGKTWVEQEK
jgi:hypothetical protein